MNRFLGILRLHPLQVIPDAWVWSVGYTGKRYYQALKHDNGFLIPAAVDRREKRVDVGQLARVLAVRMKRATRLADALAAGEARRIGGAQ